ncbi:M24 family metallopeptidase [Phormidesmis sp. 146-35]
MSELRSDLSQVSTEIDHKLKIIRATLDEIGAAGLWLRGTDWFMWATAGATHTVLLAAETGVAEVLVTADAAWILTSEIEAPRFKDEELWGRDRYILATYPWADPTALKQFVQSVTDDGKIISDRPISGESMLPLSLIQQKRILLTSEVDRYRQIGRLASEAMTEVLMQAEPTWTEQQLAGAGAQALWKRGLHPALTLSAGARRSPLYRHPVPTSEAIGQQAMLVFCARGAGLYANLTRFVCFEQIDLALHRQVAEVEAIALNQTQIGTPLKQVYQAIAQSYNQQGDPDAIRQHHQGGTTGYLSRDVIATPSTDDRLAAQMAVAWNPSLPGAKIEDTFIIHSDGRLENLTADPQWPTVEVEGRQRPVVLERST